MKLVSSRLAYVTSGLTMRWQCLVMMLCVLRATKHELITSTFSLESGVTTQVSSVVTHDSVSVQMLKDPNDSDETEEIAVVKNGKSLAVAIVMIVICVAYSNHCLLMLRIAIGMVCSIAHLPLSINFLWLIVSRLNYLRGCCGFT